MVRPQFTPQQRAFIVTEFRRNDNNVYTAIQSFRETFPNAHRLSHGTVHSNMRKYATTGTSLNLNKGRSGRMRTTRSAENIEACAMQSKLVGRLPNYVLAAVETALFCRRLHSIG